MPSPEVTLRRGGFRMLLYEVRQRLGLSKLRGRELIEEVDRRGVGCRINQLFGSPLTFGNERSRFMSGLCLIFGGLWFLLVAERFDQRVIELKPFQDIKRAF
jgi:hypothetical protein